MRSIDVPEPGNTKLREAVSLHLWKRYPQHCVILTDPRLRRAIDAGIARAAAHGFRDAHEVRAFVSLMVFLGARFDDDPQLPWAAERLRLRAAENRTRAMAGLLTETSHRLEHVVGQRGEYYRRALAWAMANDFDAIAAAHDDSDDGLHRFLRLLYRRKYEALDEGVAAQIVDLARRSAARHGLATPPGVVVYLGLMFLLGSAFDEDPFHPWAGEALAAAPPDPTDRARALHAAAIEVLRRYTRLDELMRPRASGG